MGDGGRSKYIGLAEAQRIKKLLETFSAADVAKIVGRSHNGVRDVIKRGFVAAYDVNLRRAPDDWAFYCNKLTIPQLATHYKTSREAVRRWIAEKGRNYKSKTTHPNPLAIPDDLAEVVSRLGPDKAAIHYGVCRITMRKWRRQAGLKINKPNRPQREHSFGWWERKAA